MRRLEDFSVRRNKKYIESLLLNNPRIFVKIDKNKYEQIYIDEITNNGTIIIYDNKFNRKHLTTYISNKRNLKKASATLRFLYYSLPGTEEIKIRIYDYLSNNKKCYL